MKKRGGKFIRFLAALILLLVLVDLLVMNLLVMASISGATGAGAKFRQETVVDGDQDQTILAVPISGIITDASADQFDKALTAAEADKTIKALVLEIDTPGGSASSSDDMSHRLAMFKTRKKVPVVVTMGGLATSGGYYVACGSDYIFAEPSTLTANIGVLMERFNVSELANKYGVHETTIISTGADYKNLGSMFQPENDKATQYMQGLVDVMFDQFKAVVRAGRQGKLHGDESEIFNGRAYTADKAIELGLIDKKGYAQDAYQYAQNLASAPSARVVRYMGPTLLERMLSSDSALKLPGLETKSSDSTIKVNGVEFDLRNLGDLLAPRPMYLWRGN